MHHCPLRYITALTLSCFISLLTHVESSSVMSDDKFQLKLMFYLPCNCRTRRRVPYALASAINHASQLHCVARTFAFLIAYLSVGYQQTKSSLLSLGALSAHRFLLKSYVASEFEFVVCKGSKSVLVFLFQASSCQNSCIVCVFHKKVFPDKTVVRKNHRA